MSKPKSAKLSWNKRHPKEHRLSNAKNVRKTKLEVLSHYSRGKPKCAVCGFSDIRALSIDHEQYCGHRKNKIKSGYKFYLWLKKMGYPKGYKVLCMNCQFIKREENQEYR